MKKLRARIRMFWGECPRCNSDAPNVYDCPVCNNYRHSGKPFPPSVETKHIWWERYLIYGDI